MNEVLCTPNQLSKTFKVTNETLAQWERDGKIKAIKTKGGHRRYVCNLPKTTTTSDNKQSIIYSRVSSSKQKNDLERQTQFLTSKYPNHTVIEDIGSGINFQRRGLIALLDLVFGGQVQEVVLAHKDRLTRFGFELFEHIFSRFGVSVTVLSDEHTKDPVNDLARDLLSVVTVFTARYHGSRYYSNDKMQEDQNLPE